MDSKFSMTDIHFESEPSLATGGKNGWSVPNIILDVAAPVSAPDPSTVYRPTLPIVDETKASSSGPLSGNGNLSTVQGSHTKTDILCNGIKPEFTEIPTKIMV